MVKKILIVDVNVTSSISGAVQPLSPMIGGRSVSTDSLNSEVSSNQTIFYANSFVLSAINIVIPKDFIRAFSDIGILSDRPSIGYSKPLTDLINSINDNSVFELSKAFSNLINTSDVFNRVIVFIRKPEDTLTLDDRLSILANKVLTDSINSINDNRVFALSKVVSNLVNTSGDFTVINFTKRPFETVDVLERLVVVFNKTLSDVSVIQDLAVRAIAKRLADSFTVDDSDTIDFTKGNFETIVTSDRNVLVFTKALIEVLQSLDLPAITVQKILSDANDIADFDTINFTKVNVDSVSAGSLTALNTIKPIFDLPLIEDQNILNFVKNASDLITTVDSIPRFDFIKFLTDTAIVEDLTNVFDGSTYTIDKTLIDFAISSENFSRIVGYNRSFTDEQLGQADSNIFNFGKALADINSINDDDILSVTKALSDISNINEIPIINFNKARSDQVDTIDSNIFDFTKVLADNNSINDDDILSVTKVFSDISNISEISTIDFNKVRSDQVDTSDVFNRIVSFNLSLTDVALQPDLASLSVAKTLSDVIGQFDGPVQFDSDGWAVDYVVSGYIFDTRVVFDVIKVLADSNSASDNDVIDFTKGLSDLTSGFQETNIFDFTKVLADENITLESKAISFTKVLEDISTDVDGPIQFDSDGWAVDYVVSGYIFDTRPTFNLTKPFADAVQQPDDSDVFDLNKALADFNDPLDSNIIDFIKILEDNATPLDNIDVFDGSTYSITKNLPNDSIFAEDQNTNVVDFNRAFTDSIDSITEAGTVANQNYIADYFLEDYIGESRLIT